MANQDINRAKDVVTQILKALKVSQVVFVDDIFSFSKQPQIEQVLGHFSALVYSNPDIANAVFEKAFNLDNDDIWRSEFLECWNLLSQDEKWTKFQKIIGLLGVFPATDFALKDRLQALFPSHLKRNFLALQNGRKREIQYCKACLKIHGYCAYLIKI